LSSPRTPTSPTSPSSPGNSKYSLLTQILPLFAFATLTVADQMTRKRVEHLLSSEHAIDPHAFKWEFFKQCEVNEESILRALAEEPVPKPLRMEPNGLGFNGPPSELRVVVAEKGRTILLVRGCSVILVDPG
jgi:hypothetical protein